MVLISVTGISSRTASSSSAASRPPRPDSPVSAGSTSETDSDDDGEIVELELEAGAREHESLTAAWSFLMPHCIDHRYSVSFIMYDG